LGKKRRKFSSLPVGELQCSRDAVARSVLGIESPA
jgi:hypothetical protein